MTSPRSKHGTSKCFSLEAMQHTDFLNDIDFEFFLCAVIDGDEVAIECGGSMAEHITKALETFLTKLKEKQKEKQGEPAILSYRTKPEPKLIEVQSGLI